MGGYYYAAGVGQRPHQAYVYFPRGFRIRPADFRDSPDEPVSHFIDHPDRTTWDDGVWDLHQRTRRLQRFGPEEEIEAMELVQRLIPHPGIFFADQANNPYLSYQHYYFLRDISRVLSGLAGEDDRPTMDPQSWLPLLEDRTNYEPGFRGAAPESAKAKPSPGSVGEFSRHPFKLGANGERPIMMQPSTARWFSYSWSFPWVIETLYVLFGPLSSSMAHE
jgi:hypothetical protein